MNHARVQVMPKQPPHSIEAEQSVLGGLMLNNRAWGDLEYRLSAADFYRIDHQVIYSAIAEMLGAGKACDFVTLSEHLRVGGKLESAGGAVYIGALCSDTYSLQNTIAYADIVVERSCYRAIIAHGTAAVDAGYTPDGRAPTEIVSELMVGLDRLHRARASKVKTFAEVMDVAERAIAESAATRAAGRMIGAPFGIPCIDRRTGGLVAPRFWIVAGRPSLGKSALANQFAVHAAGHGFPGYIASLEMDHAEIGIRARATAGRVNVTRLTWGGEAEREGSIEAATELLKLPIYVDTSSSDLSEIAAQIVAAKVEHGIRWAIVDNIQLVEADRRGRQDRVQELSLVSRTLKKLTIKLGIPILAVSHLSRGVEKDRRKPSLSDLKDSGSLEQDADVVCFLHSEDEDTEADKTIMIGFGKNRGGRKGWVKERVVFRGSIQKFEEIAPEGVEP